MHCNILLQVASYVMAVPKQKWGFPVLAWGKKVHLGFNIVFAVLTLYQPSNTSISMYRGTNKWIFVSKFCDLT